MQHLRTQLGNHVTFTLIVTLEAKQARLETFLCDVQRVRAQLGNHARSQAAQETVHAVVPAAPLPRFSWLLHHPPKSERLPGDARADRQARHVGDTPTRSQPSSNLRP